MRTPSRSWPLWLGGLALAIMIVPSIMWHGHLYYSEGGTSPDGPGILLAAAVYTSPMWGGAWMVFVALYLVRYPGSVALTNWRAPTWFGAALGIVAIAVSLFFIWLAIARTRFWLPSRLPFVLHLTALAAYVQVLRAVAAGRSRGVGSGGTRGSARSPVRPRSPSSARG